MKDAMINMMVAMMPFMKPVMWAGVIAAIIGLTFIATKMIFNMDMQKSITWSARITLSTALFFLVAQINGYFLNIPPTVNFGDSSKFEFILVSFWQIGVALLIASLVIKYFAKINTSQTSEL